MPTYEYACNACGAHVEVVQRFDDEPLRTCTRCGGALRKVFHPAGIVFRGSGFYATDSRTAPKGGGDGAKDTAKKEPSKTTDSSPSGTGGEKKEKSA
ncbi:MAG TPA: FmdB family zinc ribbon protein [Actinomycetota bacterium]|nr:FmdB family zinc ribbon protein [Actinomycetota bacterium]